MDKPVKFKNGRVAKNPFAVASLTNCQSNPDGTLNERELKWLQRRAVGGYGIVNTCCVHVQANGKGWEGEWGLFDEKHIEGYRRVADAIHKEDALMIVQIFHAGMRADDKLIEGTARSCVDTTYKHRTGERKVDGLTEAEIETLIEDFVRAAKRAEAAGCDGVEVHAAHGYILTQFLCPVLNTRDDKWGGPPLVNRARITREVVRRIKKAVSEDFIVGVRLSPEPGYETAGWMMDPAENIQVAKWVVEDGAHFISVSIFGHSPSHITKIHNKDVPDLATKPIAQVFAEALPKDVVVMCCGGVKTAQDVQTHLDMGIDMAVTGVTAICTPDFPKLVQADSNYERTVNPPFTPDFLASVDVSPPFIDFLQGMRMVKND